MIPESVRCTSCEGGRVACGHTWGQRNTPGHARCDGFTFTCPDCNGTQYDEAAVLRLVEEREHPIDQVLRERLAETYNAEGIEIVIYQHGELRSQITTLTTERDELREGLEIAKPLLAYWWHTDPTPREVFNPITGDWFGIRRLSRRWNDWLETQLLQRTNSHEEGTTT